MLECYCEGGHELWFGLKVKIILVEFLFSKRIRLFFFLIVYLFIKKASAILFFSKGNTMIDSECGYIVIGQL